MYNINQALLFLKAKVFGVMKIKVFSFSLAEDSVGVIHSKAISTNKKTKSKVFSVAVRGSVGAERILILMSSNQLPRRTCRLIKLENESIFLRMKLSFVPFSSCLSRQHVQNESSLLVAVRIPSKSSLHILTVLPCHVISPRSTPAAQRRSRDKILIFKHSLSFLLRGWRTPTPRLYSPRSVHNPHRLPSLSAR